MSELVLDLPASGVRLLSLWKGEVVVRPARAFVIREIAEQVATHYGLTIDDLFGPSRRSNIVAARHKAMQLAREHTRHSSTVIGQVFGGRDHTTVLHACQKVAAE